MTTLPPLNLTLRQLLGGAYLIGMTALTVMVIAFLQERLSAHFLENLLENGRTIARRMAEESRLPLIQGTVDHVRPRLETIATYPNVAGIALADAQNETVFALGSPALQPGSAPPASGAVDAIFHFEMPDSAVIIAPVFERRATARDADPYSSRIENGALAPPRPTAEDAPSIVGYVSITLSKTKLQNDIQNIQEYIFAAMLIGISAFTMTMLFLLRRITHPIKQLARIMADPETVTHFRGVEVRGVREARIIASAYNALIARVADSRADLARQVADAVREVRQQNAELIVARERAEAASRAKSQFVATVSHEIRTPLHGLLGALSLLDKTPLSDTQQNFLVMMREDADRLLREINGILDVAKLEAGGLKLHEHPCNLKSLLQRTAKQFEPRVRAKKLRLALMLDPDLPPWVRADGEQLEKIVRNLIDNAIKFTAQGRIQVRAGGRPTGEGAVEFRLFVRDSGIGIPSAQQASIFEPFAQADSSTTRKYGGSGLGLAICRQLVGLMQGRITLKSRPGNGSLFCVELPLARAEPAPEPADEPAAGRANTLQRLVAPQDQPVSERRLGQPDRLGGRWVLVVDDERQSRLYAQLVVLALNADVVTAASGEEALAACARQRFDLILMDVRMPDLDGLETTRQLRRQPAGLNARTPVVGLTADVLNLDRQDWRAAGMNACHHKPLDADTLADLFGRWGIGRPAQTASLSAFLRKYYER